METRNEKCYTWGFLSNFNKLYTCEALAWLGQQISNLKTVCASKARLLIVQTVVSWCTQEKDFPREKIFLPTEKCFYTQKTIFFFKKIFLHWLERINFLLKEEFLILTREANFSRSKKFFFVEKISYPFWKKSNFPNKNQYFMLV